MHRLFFFAPGECFCRNVHVGDSVQCLFPFFLYSSLYLLHHKSHLVSLSLLSHTFTNTQCILVTIDSSQLDCIFFQISACIITVFFNPHTSHAVNHKVATIFSYLIGFAFTFTIFNNVYYVFLMFVSVKNIFLLYCCNFIHGCFCSLM